jgi:hypothetical protein
VTRPATGANFAGPPASADGIVVNSIEGSAVDRGEAQEATSRHAIDDVTSAPQLSFTT